MEEDTATITGFMYAVNVEPIYRMSDRTLLGFRVYDGEGQTLSDPFPAPPTPTGEKP